MATWAPRLTHLPTHRHQKVVPQEKNEIYQRGPKLEVGCRYTNFVFGLCPPPPPTAVYITVAAKLWPASDTGHNKYSGQACA